VQDRLAAFFARWGVAYHAATTAAEAVAQLEKHGPPALVLLDDGLLDSANAPALLESLRRTAVPLLHFTVSGNAGTITPFGPSNLSATLSKPVKSSALERVIHQLWHPATLGAGGIAAHHVSDRLADELPLNVLLVEDNAVNQKIALRFLERLGYRADAVGNGLEAVHACESRDYDLVLMDIQMPEMDGFTASHEIRRLLPAARQPRIVALTANALQGDRDLCLQAGMDDYLTKPIKLPDLSSVIRRTFLEGSPSPRSSA